MLTPTRVPLSRETKHYLLPQSIRHGVCDPWSTPVLDGTGECYQKTPKLKMTTSPRPASKYSPKSARHRREAQQPPVHALPKKAVPLRLRLRNRMGPLTLNYRTLMRRVNW